MTDYRRWIINSPKDLRVALSEAHLGGRIPSFLNSTLEVRGRAGTALTLGDSLASFEVAVYGPSPVYVEGGLVAVARGAAVVYATEHSLVDAYDSATVYAYDRAEVEIGEGVSVYVASDDVSVTVYGAGTVYLPEDGVSGSEASVTTVGLGARIIRAVSPRSCRPISA